MRYIVLNRLVWQGNPVKKRHYRYLFPKDILKSGTEFVVMECVA